MKQQVNFYRHQSQAAKTRTPGERILRGFWIAPLAVAAFIALEGGYLYSLNRQSHALAAGYATVRTQNETLTVQLAARQADPALAQQMHRLENLAAQRDYFQSLLRDDAFATGRGYSDYFIAFARQHVSGLWLTSLRVAGAGRDISLEGATLAPERVPEYLKRLATEPVLAGVEFGLFRMERPVDEEGRAANQLEFVIATHGEGEPP